ISLPVPCDFASFLTVKARIGVPASALACAIAYATGSAPRVRPPTASGLQPDSRSAASASDPIVARPSGLMVVRRASIYRLEGRPQASVQDPPRADPAWT